MLFYHKRRKNTTHTTKIKGKFDRFLLDISTFRGYFRAHKCQTPGFRVSYLDTNVEIFQRLIKKGKFSYKVSFLLVICILLVGHSKSRKIAILSLKLKF